MQVGGQGCPERSGRDRSRPLCCGQWASSGRGQSYPQIQGFLGVCLGKVLLHSAVVFRHLSGGPAVTVLQRASPERGCPSHVLPATVPSGRWRCLVRVAVLLLLQHIWADVSGSP